MGRVARIVVPGFPHHVTQRGNRRQETFFGRSDYEAYLELLFAWAERCGVRVWGYCLMPNHVHLVLVPSTASSLARAVGEVHRRYTRRINFREGWRGYLWRGRFGSCVMDETHLLRAMAYVERNPVKAGLIERAEDWPWSSAACHAGVEASPFVERQWLTDRIGGWACSWGEYLAQNDSVETARLLRSRESTGRPLGDEAFLKTVGQLLGRNVLPKKPGRKPRKEK